VKGTVVQQNGIGQVIEEKGGGKLYQKGDSVAAATRTPKHWGKNLLRDRDSPNAGGLEDSTGGGKG